MTEQRIKLRNEVVTIQQTMLDKYSIAIILLYDINDPFKDSFIVCEDTIQCWHGNTNLITNLIDDNLSLLAILSFGSLISTLLIDSNLLTKHSGGSIIKFLRDIQSKSVQPRR